MKRLAMCAFVMAMAAMAMPATAAGGPQTVEGSIALPAPFTDDTGCYAGLHRRAVIVAGDAPQGVIGYHFDVDKATWKKNFLLEVTAGQGDVDLDIYYYLADFGTVDDVVGDPLGAGAPPTVSFNTRAPGGEASKVPEGALHVIVCMYGGQQGGGFGAEFKYTAGKGVKPPKD